MKELAEKRGSKVTIEPQGADKDFDLLMESIFSKARSGGCAFLDPLQRFQTRSGGPKRVEERSKKHNQKLQRGKASFDALVAALARFLELAGSAEERRMRSYEPKIAITCLGRIRKLRVTIGHRRALPSQRKTGHESAPPGSRWRAL